MVTILVSSDKVTKALRKDRLSQAIAKVEKDSAHLGVKIRPLMHPAILATVQKYLMQSYPLDEWVEQRRKKRTQPPPKENLLENFSGRKEKLSRPVVDTKILKKNKKTISTTEIFPLWTPFFSAKKSSALEQGGVCFLFPSRAAIQQT